MNGNRIGYIRLSSFNGKPDNQLENVQIDKKFIDVASCKDTVRPQLEELLKNVRDGDTLVVQSMDRIARNLDDLRRIVYQIIISKSKIHFIKENMTFSGDDTQIANLMISMIKAFAEFERELIRERQREGIALAKIRGAYKGRKKSLTSAKTDELIERIKSGESKSALARAFGISRETLYQYLNGVK